ncbi:1654_t:CDS:2 [Paraglomus brasilianum]|uniref:1654_t:CDS:1 n=1 Tax=Paraglomus brasilianum TaxID=144538 RepID=A0A9N8VQF3_9GLOM|nr:1654_t:CDS:2 [Paraglomus brasilianum]
MNHYQRELPVITLTPSKGEDKLDVAAASESRAQHQKHQKKQQWRASQRNANVHELSSTPFFRKSQPRVFHANNCNVLEAAQELYDDAPVGFAVKQESSDQDLAELSPRFYDHDVNLLQKILVITRGELEKAIDLMLLITDDNTKMVPGSLPAEVRSQARSPSLFLIHLQSMSRLNPKARTRQSDSLSRAQ